MKRAQIYVVIRWAVAILAVVLCFCLKDHDDKPAIIYDEFHGRRDGWFDRVSAFKAKERERLKRSNNGKANENE